MNEITPVIELAHRAVSIDPAGLCTDLQNARFFVQRHGHRFRFCDALGGWLYFDGQRWALDETGEVQRAVKETLTDGLLVKARDSGNDQVKQALMRWATKSQSHTRLQATEKLARTEPEVVALPSQFDAQPHLLNLQNGVFDLQTMKFISGHDPDQMLTQIARVEFDGSAPSDVFEQFLCEVLPDESVRRYLQTALGCALVGKSLEAKLVDLLGSGANGKTTLIEAVAHVLGDYAAAIDPEMLLERPQGVRGKADRFVLRGKRLVYTSEPDRRKGLNEAEVKRLTGGDTIPVSRLYHMPFTIEPSWSPLFMLTNELPSIQGTDEGIWRRISVVPFEVQIPSEKRDPHKRDELLENAPAILNWLIDGWRIYVGSGMRLMEPDAVAAQTRDYRQQSDPLGLFLRQTTRSGGAYSVAASKLFHAWKRWCESSGHHPGSQTAFGRALTSRGFQKSRSVTGSTLYTGHRLLPDDEWAG